MEARNTKCKPYLHENYLMYSDTLTVGFTISMYSGKTPSYMKCLLNPVNKGKYKRNVFISYLLLSFRFVYFFWVFLGQGITLTNQRGVKYNITKVWSQISNGNTALPKPLIPQPHKHHRYTFNVITPKSPLTKSSSTC